MRVRNTHSRQLPSPPEAVGQLLDSLASTHDRLWPNSRWPAMRFDRPLGVGAQGGHGPIRYFVASYTPGQQIRFQFTGPRGFHGFHGFDVFVEADGTTCLQHILEMDTRGPALLTWPLLYRWLHDALIEDALARGQAALGLVAEVRPWNLWVRILRAVLTGARAKAQMIPAPHSARP